jgi:hypothetical protein
MSVPEATAVGAKRSLAWLWLVVAALALLVAVGAIWMATRPHNTDAVPTIPPTATPSDEPSGSPLASPSTTGIAVPGQVTVDASLPSALPLPADIWSKTGPGWVLATYSPAVITYAGDANGPTVERTRQVIYLVSPAGTRYQVLELDPNDQVSISSWSAGENVAYIERCGAEAFCQTQTGPTDVLDLATGDATPSAGPAGADYIGLTLPGSTRLWFGFDPSGDAQPYAGEAFLDRGGSFASFGGGWTLPRTSPDGAWVSLQHWDPAPEGGSYASTGVLKVSSGAAAMSQEPEPGLSCQPYEWTDANKVLAWCTGDPAGDRWFTVDPATLVSSEVASPLPALEGLSVSHDVPVAPGVWAGLYGIEGALMWTDPDGTVGIDDHGTLTKLVLVDASGVPLQTVWPSTAVNGVAYFVGHQADVDQGSPETVVAYDVKTGRQTVLVPSPPAGPASQVGASDTQQAVGVTSWAVAP